MQRPIDPSLDSRLVVMYHPLHICILYMHYSSPGPGTVRSPLHSRVNRSEAENLGGQGGLEPPPLFDKGGLSPPKIWLLMGQMKNVKFQNECI